MTMMDELSLLSEARPTEAPGAAVVADARARLLLLARQESAPTPARQESAPTPARQKSPQTPARQEGPPIRARREGRRPRRRWQIAWGAGLATAAAAVGVAVAAASGALTGTPGTPPGETRPASAADLLRRASLVAAEEELAPRPDQLVHVTMTEVAAVGGGPASTPVGKNPASAKPAVTWLQPSRWQGWESAASKRPGLIRIAYGSPQPLPGQALPTETRQPADAEWQVAACTGSLTAPTYAFLSTLPTDPQELAKRVTADDPEDSWDTLSGLARAAVVPPKLRAAIYRLMADQPGVDLVTEATDAAGRPGIAVSKTLTGKGIRAQLIFAADTFRYLGERQVTTATNVTVDARAVLSVEVVDAAPAPGPNAQTADCGPNRLPR
ncbi:CU044_5270 family protein [Actinoplanes sp. LDG1-06]|uniref:CU044_5270 family protein n=1 Tax=Paractinoplanes ovalisporus TaxID=2810368 RepID=A0ABS2AM06_9ACTN|nr:CU044_5270 family protein [Actinoplanes ovalisporus]MBM2620893.1 CU044_5270 family protein [Actinoplanes ovalisporus]